MIEVDSVAVSFGDAAILEDVSLSVDRGEFVGLVGPNGVGKTTLLRTVNGALRPDSGAVRVDGDPIHDLSSRAASRRVATVPQHTGVNFAFDVESIVAMGRTPHRRRFGSDPDAGEHVDRALERTETTPLRDRQITTLSGGERQRVYIARALAQDAPAVVLDEPTASLDINHAAATLSLVRDLADDGRAALAAIHDLESAARFCDRLVMLADGAVAADGPPEEVLTATSLERAFETSAAVTTNLVTDSPSVTALPATAAAGARIHVLGGGEVAARVAADCWGAGHDVSVGPCHVGDAAAVLADRLDVPATVVPPFADLGGAAREAVRERVNEAAVTVLPDVRIGPSGTPLPLAEAADRLVAVEETPLEARNHAGDEGRRAYERLRENALVTSADSLLAAVESDEGASQAVADD